MKCCNLPRDPGNMDDSPGSDEDSFVVVAPSERRYRCLQKINPNQFKCTKGDSKVVLPSCWVSVQCTLVSPYQDKTEVGCGSTFRLGNPFVAVPFRCRPPQAILLSCSTPSGNQGHHLVRYQSDKATHHRRTLISRRSRFGNSQPR